MHSGSSYTNGDNIFHSPNMKVVAVGKLLTSSPIPDDAQVGSLLGWVPVLDEVLKPDFDTAVPAGGPPLTKPSCRLSRTSWSDWSTSQYN
ncbi:MAG TPA: hypothetical protein VF783_01750, partial [Terriglobales bacterium]